MRQYPIGIYPAWLRLSLTIVIPVGIAVRPVRGDHLAVGVHDARRDRVAVVSLLLSRIVWRHGVRRMRGQRLITPAGPTGAATEPLPWPACPVAVNNAPD